MGENGEFPNLFTRFPIKINSPFSPIGSPRDRSSVCHVPTNSFCSTHQNYHVWVKSDVDGKIYLSKEVLKITKRIWSFSLFLILRNLTMTTLCNKFI